MVNTTVYHLPLFSLIILNLPPPPRQPQVHRYISLKYWATADRIHPKILFLWYNLSQVWTGIKLTHFLRRIRQGSNACALKRWPSCFLCCTKFLSKLRKNEQSKKLIEDRSGPKWKLSQERNQAEKMAKGLVRLHK